MEIKKTPARGSSTPHAGVTSVPTPAAAPAGTPVNTTAPQAADSAFGFAPPQGRVESRHTPHVSGSVMPGGASEVRPGILNLDSPEAKQAIERSYDHLSSENESISQVSLRDQLRPLRVEVDMLGNTHVRFDRYHEGMPVFGEQAVTHARPNGSFTASTGNLATKVRASFDREASISVDTALEVALKQFPGTPEEKPVVRRVFTQDAQGNDIPAFHVELLSVGEQVAQGKEPLKMNYLVHAETQEVVDSWNQLGSFVNYQKRMAAFCKNAGLAAPEKQGARRLGEADDTSLYSGKVDIQATQNAEGQWVLRSTVDGVSIVTVDARNTQRPSGPGTDFKDANNTWGEGADDPRNKAAVDAHYSAVTFARYLKFIAGRNSIDNKGVEIKSWVHVGNNYVNAFYVTQAMHYGDGDGKRSGPLTGLDVGGHEPTHFWVETTSGLIYRGESGGGNESEADVHGAGNEWFASLTNPFIKVDMMMGEDFWTPGSTGPEDALRYMDDPTRDKYSVDHYSNYPKQTEVHGSSGIANKAFAMMVQGGTNKTSGLSIPEADGLGWEEALRIRAQGYSFYCTPNSSFDAQWKACVRGAIDLYGADSKQARITNAAWNACMTKTAPTELHV